MGLSSKGAENIIELILGITDYTMPTTTYLSFHNGDPGLTGVNEINPSWYDRKPITWGTAAVSATNITNTADVVFDQVTVSDQLVTHVGIWNHLTSTSSNNFMFSIDISPNVNFTVGSVPKCEPGDLVITPGTAYSDYIISRMLNHFFGKVDYPIDTSVYLALYTSNPTKNDSGNEVSTSGTGYVRQQITWDQVVNGDTQNALEEAFPAATGSGYGTVSHYGVKTAVSGQNLIIFGAWNTPQPVIAGDTAKVLDGALDIQAA